MNYPRGYSCRVELPPLTIEIQRTADGLWSMYLFDDRAHARVIMPPCEFDLAAAKEKALTNAEFYMRKFGGDATWIRPAAAAWSEFKPREIVWET